MPELILTPVESIFMLVTSPTTTANGEHHDRTGQTSQLTPTHRNHGLQ
jgi:hypothetical protein